MLCTQCTHMCIYVCMYIRYLHNAAVLSKVDLSLEVDVVGQSVVKYVHTGQLWGHLQVSASAVIVYSRAYEASLTPLSAANAVVQLHDLVGTKGDVLCHYDGH